MCLLIVRKLAELSFSFSLLALTALAPRQLAYSAEKEEFPKQADSAARLFSQKAASRLKEAFSDLRTMNIERDADGSGFAFTVAREVRSSGSAVRMAGSELPSAENVARDFLKSVGDVLGLREAEDQLRQRAVRAEDNGKVHILFDRYVAGLRVDAMDIRVHLDPDGVFAFSGHVVQLPPSTRAAIVTASQAAHIGEVAVWRIVADDLGPGVEFAGKTEKLAIPAEPFVIWRVDTTLENRVGRWIYQIDARSGAVLAKEDFLQTVMPIQREVSTQ